ncbi:gamma-mobile-trio recombinase GmtY [Pseudomonas putida]|uniref:gamma-mobile-trio recombinase GmtY n=1 Tax=Pseudomonas putida TaxID=303 RepID=UPI001074B25E|nr:gamma-mobile-trio recombinase GmtY [Pseudomonas putida]MCG3643988.1 site-specific integrase [Pseudomonas putida]TFW22688.1 site-specific integrase [Pseudomonas putida]
MKTLFESSHREFRRVIGDATQRSVVLPVIITDQGALEQPIRYLYLRRRKSRSWQDDAVFALQLLVDFTAVNQSYYGKPQDLFTEFSNALYTGTIQGRFDPSGLYWDPRPNDAKKIIRHITRFTDWLSKVNNDCSLQLNPWREATGYEQYLNWAAHSHRKHNAFLSHLFVDRSEIHNSREVRAENFPIDSHTALKAFPEEKLGELLLNGFRRVRRDGRGIINLGNVLITILMHYGSLRLSEALSLWCDDVTIENGEVVVRIYHPEFGLAPDGKSTRAAYLQRRYGLVPRNQLVKAIDPLYLGWKRPVITDIYRKCFEVYFFPHVAAIHFVRLWREYHHIQRVKPQPGFEHPYAFTNQYGQPYSHRMFRKAHKLAVERVGLAHGKIRGTTPHGHRHAFGQRMAGAGASKLKIKTAMHHAALSSSDPYTQPSAADFRQYMADLEDRLSEKYLDAIFKNSNMR